MTQAARPTLSAVVDDGITLSTKFNNAISALYSNHAGAAAPPSPDKGQGWVDTSGEGSTPSIHVMKAYDGAAWRTLGTLNRTSGAYTVAGNLSASGGILTGPLMFPFGTAAAPSIAFDADTDTGFYRLAANQLGMALGGTAFMTFSTTLVEVLTQQLRVSMGSPVLSLNRNNGAVGAAWMQFLSAGSTRFRFTLQGAESTGNAGGDLSLQMFDDAGVVVANVATFTRQTRQIAIGGASVANQAITLRTPGLAAAERNCLFNPSADAAASVSLELMTGAGAIRGVVAAQRTGTNDGRLVLSGSAAGVAVPGITIDSNGDAQAARDISAARNIAAAGTVSATAGFISPGLAGAFKNHKVVVSSWTGHKVYIDGSDAGWGILGLNIVYMSLSGGLNIVGDDGSVWNAAVTVSDPKIKENIQRLTDTKQWAKQIYALPLFSFDWSKSVSKMFSGHRSIGLTTTALKEVDPEMVQMPTVAGALESVDILGLVARLVAANQDLHRRLAALEGGRK